MSFRTFSSWLILHSLLANPGVHGRTTYTNTRDSKCDEARYYAFVGCSIFFGVVGFLCLCKFCLHSLYNRKTFSALGTSVGTSLILISIGFALFAVWNTEDGSTDGNADGVACSNDSLFAFAIALVVIAVLIAFGAVVRCTKSN
jgi:uncharacterized membrane protein YidH (DUF202 family)